MLTENLFETVLVAPAMQSANVLYVVSGYATATMVTRHFQRLKTITPRKVVKVELIVGMTVQSGISGKAHRGFQGLAYGPYKDLFHCRYINQGPPVHTKTYSWFKGILPYTGFCGSANYTQQAFASSRREAMVEHSAEEGRDYYDSILQDSVDCLHPDIEKLITVHDEPGYSLRLFTDEPEESDISPLGASIDGLPKVTIDLLSRGALPQRSGLNWGQRPEQHREPNQAYIRVPIETARSGFFPPRGENFTMLTDDDESFICVRAQDYGKAIHTPQDNSLFGLYFRHRLGVGEGEAVQLEDLQRYGRTNVDFYKIDEETFYMEFSV